MSISLDYSTDCLNLAEQLRPVFLAQPGEIIDLKLSIGVGKTAVYCDGLLLIAAAIVEAKSKGVVIIGSCSCTPHCEGYVSRVNFFDSIGVDFSEDFVRRESRGKFLEITRFNDPKKGNDLISEVSVILKSQKFTDESILSSLELALAELVSNIFDHSEKGYGWMTAQYFKSKKRIRIMVADTGIGIHKALTGNPKNSEFKDYTPKESIENCIVKGVTNGKGGGNGLYITSNLIYENGGTLTILSGSNYLTYTKNRKESGESHWDGTAVFLEINSNRPVDVNKINGGDTSFVDMYRGDNDFDDWFS